MRVTPSSPPCVRRRLDHHAPADSPCLRASRAIARVQPVHAGHWHSDVMPRCHWWRRLVVPRPKAPSLARSQLRCPASPRPGVVVAHRRSATTRVRPRVVAPTRPRVTSRRHAPTATVRFRRCVVNAPSGRVFPTPRALNPQPLPPVAKATERRVTEPQVIEQRTKCRRRRPPWRRGRSRQRHPEFRHLISRRAQQSPRVALDRTIVARDRSVGAPPVQFSPSPRAGAESPAYPKRRCPLMTSLCAVHRRGSRPSPNESLNSPIRPTHRARLRARW